MSATRSAPRPLVRIVAASAAVLGGLLAAVASATPAHAEDGDVKVTLSGLDSSLRAGRNEDFTVRTENRLDQEINAVRRVIVVRLDGLNPDQVNVSARGGGVPMVKSSSGSGEVRFDEALGYRLAPDGDRGDSDSVTLTIRFNQSAPGGEVTVTAYAMRFGAILGSASDTMDLKSDAPTPTPTPSSEAPATSAPPTGAGPTQVQTLDPETVAGITDASGIPPFLYVLGAVLVLLGGGILWLLFRPEKPALVEGYGVPAAYDTRAYEQVRPPSLGYPAPRHGANLNPTTVMPAVDPNTPPPADPWADGGTTQQFPTPRH